MHTARETIYFSRFPDVPPVADVITIHEGPGCFLVFSWFWKAPDQEWEQALIGAPDSLEDARTLVPAGAAPLSFPAEFSLEAYEVCS